MSAAEQSPETEQHRHRERDRLIALGRRSDSGERCTLLVTNEAAKYPDDPQLTALVGELSVQDTQFHQWWAAHYVAGRRLGTKNLHHPVVGDLSLDWTR